MKIKWSNACKMHSTGFGIESNMPVTLAHSAEVAWGKGDCPWVWTLNIEWVRNKFCTTLWNALETHFMITADFWMVDSSYQKHIGFLVAQMVKNLHARGEPWVWSLGQEEPLEMRMSTLSGILAWRIPWSEEPGGIQSMGSQRVGHDWATNTHTYTSGR